MKMSGLEKVLVNSDTPTRRARHYAENPDLSIVFVIEMMG